MAADSIVAAAGDFLLVTDLGWFSTNTSTRP
jgi:hypothetical protein